MDHVDYFLVSPFKDSLGKNFIFIRSKFEISKTEIYETNNTKKRNPQISKGTSLINSLITVLKVWSYFLENDQTFETVSELRSDMWLNFFFFIFY